MRDRFQRQIAQLDKACRDLQVRPDDHSSQEAVRGALAAMVAAPYSDESPLVRGLANLVRQRASILEYHLEQKGGPPVEGKLVRTASEVCIHIGELKQALERCTNLAPHSSRRIDEATY